MIRKITILFSSGIGMGGLWKYIPPEQKLNFVCDIERQNITEIF